MYIKSPIVDETTCQQEHLIRPHHVGPWDEYKNFFKTKEAANSAREIIMLSRAKARWEPFTLAELEDLVGRCAVNYNGLDQLIHTGLVKVDASDRRIHRITHALICLCFAEATTHSVLQAL